MEGEPTGGKGHTWVWILIVVIFLIIAGGVAYFYFSGRTSEEGATIAPSQTAKTQAKWQEQGVAISGQFADADVISLGNGQYRMYFANEPEAGGGNLEIYSAISTDGVSWTREEGTRKTMATFPDVIKLPDPSTDSGQAGWRMYYQNMGVIKSAKSTDGLTWTDEQGTRVDKDEPGYSLESVGAQSTIFLDDGTYAMIYRGTIPEPYQTSEKIPNQNTQLYFWAASKDGLNFEKKGLAIDSRNETLYGLADGAEWVDFDGEMRVYFWSYTGVYHVVYSGGRFSEPVFDFTNKNKTGNQKFTPDPPGDPTILKINGQWMMYYGQHTRGIFRATLS